MSPHLPIDPALSLPTPALHGVAALRDRVLSGLAEFGPLVVALAGGALLGAASSGLGARSAWPAGAVAEELALVVLVAGLASAAILPRRAAEWRSRSRTSLPQLGVALGAQRLFLLALCALAPVLAAVRGLDATIAWAPVVLFLQTALAAGLGFFAAAAARTRLGRLLPARVLVPAWILASPGAWLLHAPTAEAAPAWNPLHHLVAAWRAILLPGVGTSEPIGEALLALAPAALLCAVAGFTAFVASESGEDAPRA
ncbi:MAG: hypothetical protein NTY35_11310 [Planctomycetota bacterium]|nr:hypothetical protein [Planctomycetota bacterium]